MRGNRTLRRLGSALVATGALVAGLAPTATAAPVLDPVALQGAYDKVHEAGMLAIYAEVREGKQTWRGAAGDAKPYFSHCIGSLTKSVISAAVLQQVACGKLALDAPIGDHLPAVVPGELGRKVTIRMLLNHTSGIADHIRTVFKGPSDFEANRFRTFEAAELVRSALALPPTGAPGERWSYSNTNYLIVGLLLDKVYGGDFRTHVTRNVLLPAGMWHTSFPGTDPKIRRPHAKAYEALFGEFEPPKDFSVYNMSWAGAAGELVSTMDDVNRFYGALFTGRLLAPAQLAEMKRTVPILDASGTKVAEYGLGVQPYQLPCGTFWGHDGAVWGMGTLAATSADGKRQVAFGYNLMKYQRLSPTGEVIPHPKIDPALGTAVNLSFCGTTAPAPALRTLTELSGKSI